MSLMEWIFSGFWMIVGLGTAGYVVYLVGSAIWDWLSS